MCNDVRCFLVGRGGFDAELAFSGTKLKVQSYEKKGNI